jgi:hypothetical protein
MFLSTYSSRAVIRTGLPRVSDLRVGAHAGQLDIKIQCGFGETSPVDKHHYLRGTVPMVKLTQNLEGLYASVSKWNYIRCDSSGLSRMWTKPTRCRLFPGTLDRGMPQLRQVRTSDGQRPRGFCFPIKAGSSSVGNCAVDEKQLMLGPPRAQFFG